MKIIMSVIIIIIIIIIITIPFKGRINTRIEIAQQSECPDTVEKEGREEGRKEGLSALMSHATGMESLELFGLCFRAYVL
jgi:hypothetical protein